MSAGLVPFCTASDGGGSIRTPASFTGLVGLKYDVRPHPHVRTERRSRRTPSSVRRDDRGRHRAAARRDGRARRARSHVPAASQRSVRRRGARHRPVRHPRRLVGRSRLRGRRPRGRRDCASRPPRRVRRPRSAPTSSTRTSNSTTTSPSTRASKASTSSSASSATCGSSASTSSIRSSRRAGRRRQPDDRCRGRPPSRTTVAASSPTSPRSSTTIDLLVTPMSCDARLRRRGADARRDRRAARCTAGMAVVLAMLANLVNLPAISVPAGLTADGLPDRSAGDRAALPRGPAARGRRHASSRPAPGPATAPVGDRRSSRATGRARRSGSNRSYSRMP